MLDSMKRYLLLGGSGFIGSRLMTSLALENEVVVVGRRPSIDADLQNVKYKQLDFVNCEDFSEYVRDVDVVVHLISTIIPSEETDSIALEMNENIKPTLALLRDVSRLKKKVIFMSSGGTIYGNCEINNKENSTTNPICNYGIVKLTIEKYLELFHEYYGLDYRIIRPSNPYSEIVYHNKKQGIIPIIIDSIINKKTMRIYGKKQVRDYIHIDDLIDGVTAVLNYNGDERIFNIGTGIGYSTEEVIKIIEERLDKKLQIELVEARKCDVHRNVLDVSLIKQETGWRPKITLEEGIERAINNRLKDV